MSEMILRPEMNLPRGVRPVTGMDGISCLEFSSVMATFYWMTYGELTPFFAALKEGKLIGTRCESCGTVLIPAVSWHCPNCSFAKMEELELPHRGKLAFTAPITAFPSTYFIGQAPFCRGYVDIVDTEPRSFMPARFRTTRGLPEPGIFVQGAEVKLVFKDQREGRITDILWVPMEEVPEELRDEEPLLASKLRFETPQMPDVKSKPELEPHMERALSDLGRMSDDVSKSPRAQKDLAGRTHSIEVRTAAGDLFLSITNGEMSITRKGQKPDFTMVCEDPAVFSSWTSGGSLTDSQVEGLIWLPNEEAFSFLPFLDRLPRSIRRDRQEGKID